MAQLHRTTHRLRHWWTGDAEPPAPALVATPSEPRLASASDESSLRHMRREADRAVMTRIATFLATHDLSPTAEHLVIARTYVLDEDRALTEAIDTQLRLHGRIAPQLLDRLAARADRDRPSLQSLAELADRLDTTLAESRSTIGESRDTARAYGAALGDEIVDLRVGSGGAGGALERLVALSTAAVERTQELSERLDAMARETQRLRGRLQAARRDAEHDHLTRLPNRRSFDARLARGGGDAARCVALCDIDDFKHVNDRHGHDAGDRVLCVVARHLKAALGKSVMVARHGGEEFACLFEGVPLHVARDALDAARDGLAERSFVNQDNGAAIGRVTLSIGLAPLADSPRAAMRAADAALYAAKRAGKNRIAVATPDETG